MASFTWGPLSGGAHLLLTPAGGSTGYHYYRYLLRLKRVTRFWQSESTAARRRFHLYLVDATDGLTPETGEAAGQPQVSKNGGAWANTSATLTAIGNGTYYVELTDTELDTLGGIAVRYKSANTAEFSGEARIEPQPLSPTTAGRTLDVTATGAAGIDWANIEGASSAANLSSTTVSIAGTVNAVGSGAITTGSFVGGAITSGVIASNAIGASQIATDAITAGKIAAGAIGVSEFSSTAIDAIADQVWDEALSGHTTAGSAGKTLQDITVPPTAAAIADAVWDESESGHLTAGTFGEQLASLPTASGIDSTLTTSHGAGSWVDAGGLTAAAVADAVWDEVATDHATTGTMGANLQVLADSVLIWPTPVGGGIAASTLITRAKAIADVHDNFVNDTEWLSWINQEQYALRLFLARNGWQLPFDTTTATITSTGWTLSTNGAAGAAVALNSGHYVFTPTLADVMAIVSVHQSVSGRMRKLTYNNAVDFMRQTITGTVYTGEAREYRCRMYGNETHFDFYPNPVSGETYVLTHLTAPTALTATTQAIALPMGWEERIVLGIARRALIKEESDPSQIEKLLREMDSQIEQLCWSRVMSEAPMVRNTDPNVNNTVDFPTWQYWYWR